jgi:hypothetical protein
MFLHHILFQFLFQQVKIVISMDGVRMLINVIIANLIQVDLVLCVVLFCKVGATIAAQAKHDLYYDRYSTNMFLFLLIEVFKFLHQHMDNFFHQFLFGKEDAL